MFTVFVSSHLCRFTFLKISTRSSLVVISPGYWDFLDFVKFNEKNGLC